MSERTTVGLSKDAHSLLTRLSENGIFNEMLDGYRLAIALALAHGVSGSAIEGSRQTFVNVGSLDKDGLLRRVIETLAPDSTGDPYDHAERLAEWGVREIWRRYEQGPLDFAAIIEEVEATAAAGG